MTAAGVALAVGDADEVAEPVVSPDDEQAVSRAAREKVRATAAGKTVFAGPLGEMRHWSPRSFRVPTGAQTALKARFWLPESAVTGYQHRTGDLKLEFKLAPAEQVG